MRTPMFGMTQGQEDRFFRYCDRLRKLGYCVLSEPLPGQIEGWLDGIASSVGRIEKELGDVNRAYRTRGRSRSAVYHLTSRSWFDPGFGIHLTYEQQKRNEQYSRWLAGRVARFDAAFVS